MGRRRRARKMPLAGGARKAILVSGALPMTPTTLQLVQITLQALSSFAIAGGLIFPAIQFRQSRQSQVVATFSKLVELQYELRRMRVQHPEYASVNPLAVGSPRSERGI